MSRKLQPFRRADGVFELAILGNFGLANIYNSTDKVTHFVEDTDAGTEIDPDGYYVQIDDGYTLAGYKSDGVHLLRNIKVGDDEATYEHFATTHDEDDQDDWLEEKCPASDFGYLMNREKLIPVNEVN